MMRDDSATAEHTGLDDSEDQPRSGYVLYIIEDGAVVSRELPRRGELTIGRSSRCDVTVDRHSISRLHAVLRVDGDIELEDMGSANGTIVRGEPIEPNSPVEIDPGDVIEIGKAMLIVRPRFKAPKKQRVVDHQYFAQRLQEECDLSGRIGAGFAVVRARFAAGSMCWKKFEACVHDHDPAALLGRYGPNDYEILMSRHQRHDAAAGVVEFQRRCDAKADIDWGVAIFPRDGTDAHRLIACASDAVRGGPMVGGTQIVIGSPAMKELYRLAERVAQAEINVLILGETGVGKEVLAQRIHESSPRAGKPLVRFSCASLSPSLLESELYGHVKGAFTGAAEDRAGLLESAHGGTVFLDEIGELDLNMQTKLLRVIEERTVRRVGSVEPVPIDVRIVAATNRDLESEVEAGRFRLDLFYRLNGFTLIIPPLRERVEEISALADAMARRVSTTATLTPAAHVFLRRQRWPGNVRELRNAVERAVIVAEDDEIGPEHLQADNRYSSGDLPAVAYDEESGPINLRESVEAAERRTIERALARAEGSQTRAAKLLGVSRQTLITRLDAYGMPRPRKSRS